MAVTQLIGAKIHRREDPRLVSGHGRYIDDLNRPGQVYATFVRSPYAHAKIQKIDLTEAKAAAGVRAVYTAKDFQGQVAGTHPTVAAFAPEKKTVPDRFPIASGEAAYQGEIVAVVLADTKSAADDAANLVQVDYDVLPAVGDLEKALEPNSPKAHTDLADNLGWDMTLVPWEATDSAFGSAEVVVKERILQQRLAPTPMETRGVLAEYDTFDKRLTIWMSNQNPHFIRLFVGGALSLPESSVRVISQDVGGGFGSKISPYPEDYLVPAMARMGGRPVKWIETRTESIQNTTHGRGQIFDVEVAAKKDGTLLGMRLTQYLDLGAYHGTFGAFQACACVMAGGAYHWQGISARTVGVLTNKVPTDPYRGAGRPEATHLVERMLDRLAQEIGMDPIELRRKNFIQASEFPYTQNFGLVIDSGDYEKSLAKAMSIAGYDELRKRQADLRGKGRYLGIGVSTWIELCGFGPSALAGATAGVALVESAQVRVHPTGSVAVYTGTHSHGQGHETTFAQIVADTLGVPYEQVEIRHGDTNEGPSFGYGTYGSRSLAVGGMAIHRASQRVVDKAKKLAAHMLEAAEEDIVFDQGKFHVKGSPEKAKAMGEVAFAAYGAGLPEGMEHGLEAVAYFDPPNLVWPFGAHIAVVEVDPETGSVKFEKYVAVDDCGNVINPMVVEGQLHGGIVQGFSQALFEDVAYDEASGQLRTGTMLDYMVPTAVEIPDIQLDSTVTPTPVNDLGVKGIGEAGTIAASVAVINAITDAVSPFGITHVDMPASPDRLWKQIKEARGVSATSANGGGGAQA
ncbi:MAG: xanthine dehydrogenase family protein molybdopterin-binding subunit [Chloroflexi bacterium]|nr:MAG: xanthine dehydrogenase family protein molybdopterin-binding subunit [Chloroflexota bacterium]